MSNVDAVKIAYTSGVRALALCFAVLLLVIIDCNGLYLSGTDLVVLVWHYFVSELFVLVLHYLFGSELIVLILHYLFGSELIVLVWNCLFGGVIDCTCLALLCP